VTEADDHLRALESLYRAEYGGLVRAVTVAVADQHAAEELVQEVFVQALRHWPKVAGYDEPAAWLKRVAAGRAANHRRDRARRSEVVSRLRSLPAGGGVGERPTGVDEDLLAALAALPERQRLTVALYYLLDQPAAAVADQLGVTEGTVRSQLHAARQQLGRVLVPEGGVER
jgi:RNA polymerase sigma-70 factor (ECF subfamily)